MRIAIAIAAGMLWVSAAYAQTSPDTTRPDSSMQSAPEPSSSQASSPAAASAPDASATTNAAQGQTVDPNHQMICHTTNSTGSRLARHATRVCKTRQQWEQEQLQDQEIMRHLGTVQGQTG
ncbi:MAG: hypothetical protein JSS00_03395 [Proteobacteria bacterium]|nr:hypothetical protein [Pseudomonadota bacterium]